jgi:hypothetical protein
MIRCLHEKPNPNVNASRSKQRAFTGHGATNPGSPHGDKDRGFVVGIGGSTSGVDRRRVRINASELKPLDAWSERSRIKGLGTGETAWTSTAVNPKSSAAIRGRFREASLGIWVTAPSMGWPHFGCSSEVSVWDNLESSPSTVLDASIGVSTEAGGIYISSRQERRGQAISSDLKKTPGVDSE